MTAFDRMAREPAKGIVHKWPELKLPEERGFGSVGRVIKTTEIVCDFTFMLVCPRKFPEHEHLRDYWQVVILDGSVPFEGRMMGLGDIGPMKITDPGIRWLR